MLGFKMGLAMKQNSPKFQLNKWENSSSNSSAIVDSTIRKQLISTVTNKQGSQIPFQMFFLLNTIYHCDHDVVDSHLNVPPVILTEMVGQTIGCPVVVSDVLCMFTLLFIFFVEPT